MLRGVEFIYKEPGVNKPLASEDDEKKNLNNTKYRIQINKVAKFYLQAIGIDSNFAFATVMLSMAYSNQEMYDQAKKMVY